MSIASAQGPDPSAQREAMKKFEWLAGHWKGEGWMDRGGQRAEFKGTETVTTKLDGLALLVEGKFNADIRGEERTVHETLAIISYDPKSATYRFQTHLANGASGEHQLELLEQGFRWSLSSPRGQMRYTMKLNEKGEWFEIGERSADGKEWQKFFEMTLRRE